MSLPRLSISPGARFTTDLFRDQTAVASSPAGALITSVPPAICVLLMGFLENPWPLLRRLYRHMASFG
jgi:hypothetical protein